MTFLLYPFDITWDITWDVILVFLQVPIFSNKKHVLVYTEDKDNNLNLYSLFTALMF